MDELAVRWANPRPISLLIGAGLTVFAYDFHLRAYEHTLISQNW
jgi:hypothetical protein